MTVDIAERSPELDMRQLFNQRLDKTLLPSEFPELDMWRLVQSKTGQNDTAERISRA